uniref:von Willebrand factor A domain-containing protein 7-like n=1 Tax=Doryrhamphus excisus TaxID=161450 RepID=UPI0025AE3C44|nr:von Willebrand factor A domain-containing protein 7-like [Doryrhamphus excisus]XP_057944292.1 von Willebrand factor A domain-containing protein 7-like [Doryrhamphus excisus]XP_057944293.1 von Willebrand factor A domain-containing protein 7-like [Doryrhamphus excisus]
MLPALDVLGFLLILTGAQGFGILPGDSQNHLDITEAAILNATVQVCRVLAENEGNDFTFPSQPFTVTGVATACRAGNSIRSFQLSILSIIFRNVRVDIRQAFNASFHFDDESFNGGRNIILTGLAIVKFNIQQEDFEVATENLGTILHPLQDFYSHSNWVENNNRFPNSNLIRSDTSIGNIAAQSQATCRSCDGDDCSNNILEDIMEGNILTSGYFAVLPGSTKPSGKCSHGGALDVTSRIDPTGGINKDTLGSEHGFLHEDAATLATMATSEILENIRQAVGDILFLQTLGISRGSGKALCFVIDTTQSMTDDIAAVQNATSSLINSVVGTDDQPLSFILVTFNDPEFGPLMRTSDPQVFQGYIDDLSASGGGDEAELSLSGLQLALMGAPRSSDIFLFTDAPAKDVELKNTVIALIERTQSVVNFLITGTTTVNRRRSINRQHHNRIAQSDAQVYQDLAQAAGGVFVEVESDELLAATTIIRQIANSSVVTLLQATRDPGMTVTFSFLVDETTTNVIVYITADSVSFRAPDGSTNTDMNPLFTSTTVGNLQIFELKNLVGEWTVDLSSLERYSLRVTGQSPIDFLVDFVEFLPLLNASDVLDTRPTIGTNGSLLVTLTGSDTASVTEVMLVEVGGTGVVEGTVVPQGSGQFLVHVDEFPSVPFVVRITGSDVNATTGTTFNFRRQLPTNFQASSVTIEAEVDRNLVPGTNLAVNFSATTTGAGGNFSVRVTTNDQRFTTSAPSTILLQQGETTNDTVIVSAPLNTPSGTTITLTIEIEGTGSQETNYIVLRITVFNTVMDFSPPVCEVLSIVNCIHNCSNITWEVSLRVSDGTDGTGVDQVTLTQGNGTLDMGPSDSNENITLVTYNATCNAPDLALLVVDRVGNTDTCTVNAFQTTAGVASLFNKVHLACVLSLALGLLQSL